MRKGENCFVYILLMRNNFSLQNTAVEKIGFVSYFHFVFCLVCSLARIVYGMKICFASDLKVVVVVFFCLSFHYGVRDTSTTY